MIKRREKEERERNARIRKARGLENGWRLNNLCRNFIRENSDTWQELSEKREEEKKNREREDQRAKAKQKKEEYLKKKEKEQRVRKITEMLQEIPKDEKDRIEREVNIKEKQIFTEIKQNLWRKWRGKQAVMGRTDKIPTGMDKIEERMIEIEKKILEMREEEEKARKRAAKTKKAKDEEKKRKERIHNHWMMMGWLTRYIEKNKFNWERRRTVQEKEKEQQDEYEEWRRLDPDDQIKEMKGEEDRRNEIEKRKLERNDWTRWRETSVNKNNIETDRQEQPRESIMGMMTRNTREMKMKQRIWREEKEKDRTEEPSLKDTDEGDKPGWGSSAPKSRFQPEKLGGWGNRGVGAYEEIPRESIALHKAGPLADPEGEGLSGEEDERGVGGVHGQEDQGLGQEDQGLGDRPVDLTNQDPVSEGLRVGGEAERGVGGGHGQEDLGPGQEDHGLEHRPVDLTNQDHGEDHVADRHGLIDLASEGTGEEINELDLTGINELCLTCVMIPCICILTTLTGRLEDLGKLRVRMDGGGDSKMEEKEESQEGSGKILIEDKNLVRKKRMSEEDSPTGSRQEDRKSDDEDEEPKEGEERRTVQEQVEDESDQGQGHRAGAQEGQDKVGGQNLGTKADCLPQDRTSPVTPDTPYLRSIELDRKNAEEGRSRKSEDPGEEVEEQVPSKYSTKTVRQEDREEGGGKNNQKMTGTIPKQGKPTVRKAVRKKEDKKPALRSKNIMEVMKMWQEKDRGEKKRQYVDSNTPGPGTYPPQEHREPPTGRTNVNVQLTVENDVENVETDKTSDIVDLTSSSILNLTDSAVSEESCPLTVNQSGTLNNLMHSLPRKRKSQPVDLVEGSPGRKKVNTPLRGGRRKLSEIKVNKHANTNLITNHFKPFSLARAEGQAAQDAVGARDGGDGGGGGTVPNARAKLRTGLAWGELGGQTRRAVTEHSIGPDQTAAGILSNPGQLNIQLIREKFQRGNAPS